MGHEVLYLRPIDGETKLETAWQCLMVEFGIDFAFDENHELPDKLPEDMSGVKALLVPPDSWEHYHAEKSGERIRKFVEEGGVIYRAKGPKEFNEINENVTRGGLEMIMASAGLTLNNPNLRQRLQNRSFRNLYELHRDDYFMRQINLGIERGVDTVFNEPYAYLLLHTMEAFHEYDPSHGWQDILRDTIDQMLALIPEEAVNIDRTTGLAIFARLTQKTGDERYLNSAHKLLTNAVENFPRIEGVPVLAPGRDQILWNECLAHLPPACVAIGTMKGEDELIELAVHVAKELHQLNYEPAKKLWYHWGAPGRRGPAIWARGQGWALTGLVGILRHLPAEHPNRELLIGYVDEIVDGLNATQNAEGTWHNVMDDPTSRVAARASAMFVYLIAEARRNGWVNPDRVDKMLHLGWRGVRGRVWRDRLACVCCGTGAGANIQHYLARPMLFYGASAALRAGVNYTLAFAE